ncbi:MAG: hypothetical protein Q6K80_03350 [Thermostichus sp. DG_1_6_bins_120]
MVRRHWQLLLILAAGILSGCSEEPVSTVPLDGTAVGTRTATPEGQSFADIQPGRDPRIKHLWAGFLITPEQLQSAQQAPITLNPTAILPCTDCETLQWQPGSPTPTPPSRALGTYTPADLSLILQIKPGENSTHFSGRFELDSTTPLIHPGAGVRLTFQQAFWKDLPLDPLPQPLDFTASQITRGRSQERSWTLPFALPAADEFTSTLRLELLLTSPIPPASAPFQRGKPLPPPAGKLYHAAIWPGSPTREQLFAYRQTIGQPPAWVEVEHRWDPHQDFPQQLANRIRESGSVPYLRLQLAPDQLPSLAAGEQDETLRSWTQGIQRFATPVILAVAVGDGDLQTQQQAYRHLMQTLRSPGNLLWVVELDEQDVETGVPWAVFPEKEWLKVQLSGDPSGFAQVYRRLTTLAPQVPLLLGGLDPSSEAAAAWLQGLETQQWPQVIGWSWSLNPEGIPSPAAQSWRQHLQQSAPWLGEILVQPAYSSPSPAVSPTL